MRIAVLGAVASALMGGTLAVTPLTSVSTPLPAAGPCSNGGAPCQRVASVLMPETPPSAPGTQAAPAANAGEAPKPAADAANPAGPGGPPTPGGSIRAVPGTCGGATAAAGLPGGFDTGLPDAAAAVLP